jgi:hypothetical protein
VSVSFCGEFYSGVLPPVAPYISYLTRDIARVCRHKEYK